MPARARRLFGRQPAIATPEEIADATVRVASVLLSPGGIEDGLRRIAQEALCLWRADEAAVRNASQTFVLEGSGPVSGLAVVGRRENDDATQMLAVPFPGPRSAAGVLELRRRTGRPPFTADDQRMAGQYAERTAALLRKVEARTDAERRQVIVERERIARDLHDHVIGRLVGAGMTVNGLSRWITDPVGRQRLSEGLDELDSAVRDIRASVHALRHGEPGIGGPVQQIRNVATEAAGHLGFDPVLTVAAAVDQIEYLPLLDNVIAVLRESLANVARHAGARHVDVEVDLRETPEGRFLRLRVTDDGCGTVCWPGRQEPGPDGGHGLVNLAYRAEALGGTFRVQGEPRHGSVLVWEAPVPERPGSC